MQILQAPVPLKSGPATAKPPPQRPPPPPPLTLQQPSSSKKPVTSAVTNFFRPAGTAAPSRPPSAASARLPPPPSRGSSAAMNDTPRPGPAVNLADELFPDDEPIVVAQPKMKPKLRQAAPVPAPAGKGKGKARVIEDDKEDGDAADMEFADEDDEHAYWSDGGDDGPARRPQLLNTVIDVFSDDEDDDGDIIFDRPATQRPPGRSTAAGGAGLVNRDHQPGPMRGSPPPRHSQFVSTLQPSMRRGFEALFAQKEMRGSDDDGEVQKMTTKTAKAPGPKKAGGWRGRGGFRGKGGRGRAKRR